MIQLRNAAYLNFLIAALHIAIIFGGPDWYRFFGAGEEMAQLDESGSSYPTIVTLCITLVFSIWGFYALSGAGLMLRLPFLKSVLILITGIFFLRGIAGLVLPFISNHPSISQNSITFWIVSSVICCVIGFVHLSGLKNRWGSLNK